MRRKNSGDERTYVVLHLFVEQNEVSVGPVAERASFFSQIPLVHRVIRDFLKVARRLAHRC
jgi:hypothetical protein